MQSILQQLFDSDIGLDGTPFPEDSPFMITVRDRREKLNKLMEQLNDEQKELLETCEDTENEINETIAYRKFVYGFRLGSLIMMEIMDGKGEMTSC